jgi:membrane-bound serine protease (ClpP class)
LVALLLTLPVSTTWAAGGSTSTGGGTGTLIALYLGGLAFLLFEVFLAPGFGLPGLTGLGLLSANLYLVFQGYGASMAWAILVTQLLLGVAATVATMKILPYTALGRSMTNSTTLRSRAPVAPVLDPDLWVGREGKTRGTLCPQGTVLIEGQEVPAKVQIGTIKANQAITTVINGQKTEQAPSSSH